jgi:hypothetical protein
VGAAWLRWPCYRVQRHGVHGDVACGPWSSPLDPVNADDGYRGDLVGDGVENNARLTARGGVAARVIVKVVSW